MSAKDVIEKILRNNTRYVTQDDISSSPFVKTPEAIFEEDIPDTAQQILDSLPRLSRDNLKKMLLKWLDGYYDGFYEVWLESDWTLDQFEEYRLQKTAIILDQICSLIPEHKWVQTTDDKGNVIVPLGEVVATATGKVKLKTRYESQLGEEVTKITIGKENLKMMEILKDFEGKPVKIIIVKGDK